MEKLDHDIAMNSVVVAYASSSLDGEKNTDTF